MSTESERITQRMQQAMQASKVYMESQGYHVDQINGQRHSVLINTGQPSLNLNQLEANKKECEVFIGKIPRDMLEDELYPILKKAGPIYKLRIMMDFSCTNRGFGFCQYLDQASARRAVNELNNFIVRMGQPDESIIGICASFDNKRLFFGNLPTNVPKERLLKELQNILDNVVGIEFPSGGANSGSRSPDKRFAFVSFKSHEAATKARRILVPGDVKLFGNPLTVDWARVDRLPSSTVQPPSSYGSTSAGQNLSSSSGSNIGTCGSRRVESQVVLSPPLSKPTYIDNLDLNNNYLSSVQGLVDVTNLYNNNSTSTSCGSLDILGERAKQMLQSSPASSQIQSPPLRSSVIARPTASTLWNKFTRLNIGTRGGLVQANFNQRAQHLHNQFPLMKVDTNQDQKVLTVSNINFDIITENQLVKIFQLSDRLKIISKIRSSSNSLTLTYESKEHANWMLTAIRRFPSSFADLALPNRSIFAHLESDNINGLFT